MATKSTHSPTPWTIRNTVIVDSTPDVAGKFVGQCPLLETCPDVAANRRHVVRCVNAYDELVEALKEVRAAITAVNRGAGETVFNPAATQLVDAALAKVQ